MQINIVDTLLGYISEYVKIEIRNHEDDELLTYYDGRNAIDERYLGRNIKNFVVDNGLVTIWIYQEDAKMDFTLTELKMLTSAIVTEIIRIEDKKHLSENDKERIKTLYNLGDKIDEEKIRKFRKYRT